MADPNAEPIHEPIVEIQVGQGDFHPENDDDNENDERNNNENVHDDSSSSEE